MQKLSPRTMMILGWTIVFACALALVAIFTPVSPSASQGKIAWSEDIAAALQQSRASGKPILIDFRADWCGPCVTMDEDLWSSDDAAALVTAHYVPVRVDLTPRPPTRHAQEMVQRYAVQPGRRGIGIPLLVLLSPEGKVAARLPGYSPAHRDHWLDWLRTHAKAHGG